MTRTNTHSFAVNIRKIKCAGEREAGAEVGVGGTQNIRSVRGDEDQSRTSTKLDPNNNKRVNKKTGYTPMFFYVYRVVAA